LGLQEFDAAAAYGFYDGPLRKLIHVFKYGKVETLAGPFARMMVRALPAHQRFDAIVPVPMHWWPRLKRGFNQTEKLAMELSARTGIPVLHAVRRVRNTPRQASLSAAERRRNLAKVFRPARGLDLAGKRVLLVDDVFTTGSTAQAVSKALKEAGTAHITVATIARADRRDSVEPVSIDESRKQVLGAY
jgi:ComF family protein